TIALIVVPLVALTAYTWHELSTYSNRVIERRNEIIDSISESLARNLPVEREGTRANLQAAFTEGLTRSAEAIKGLREQAALLVTSLTIFFFTIYYVLTHRIRIASYIKVRVPGEYLPFYEKLTVNVGGALRGALRAVFIDQSLKSCVIVILNLIFGVPLAVVLGLVTFLIGFFPLLGEWAVYIPVAVYLFVFRNAGVSAGLYLLLGVAMTLGSSLLLRPKLASAGARRFNFYWMLVALVAGVYAFGVSGVVLGPAILGFTKAVADTLFGDVRYETSLLREEVQQRNESTDVEAGAEPAGATD
ncbi:MAG TPA: AI-2E family transporter, partial [Pyrinomonadaceae bacterium]|nr:AI-2E family transporter [Pyrinomonadaceae bacterium]